MVATAYETHHHYHQSEPKMNDIFEQTVIVDKPLSTHFYDNLKEVTIDAEIIVGRKGIIEEIVPLEQWASVISDTFTEIPEEEDWVIEPEEVVYTVVKWEGIEGGEKHIIENKKWTEVAHTPPIHTKHHISPLTGLETEHHNFSFSSEDIHDKKVHANHSSDRSNIHANHSSESSNRIIFEKPHVSATTETTWQTSHHHNTTATHQSSETLNGGMNGYSHTVKQNDEPLGAWHKVQSPTENNGAQYNNSSTSGSYQMEEQRSTWNKIYEGQTPRPTHLQRYEEEFTPTPPTRIPKPRTSPSAYSKLISPESPSNGETRMTSQKVTLKSNGNTVFSGGYSPQPSPPAVHHQFISAKPACHSTFMTSYTSNSSPEQMKSPPRTPGAPPKVTWRRTHGNQYVRETVSTNNSK